MRAILKIVVTLIVSFIAYLLYRILSKKNKEEKMVPKGMCLMTINPELRYQLYAVGIFFFAVMVVGIVVCGIRGDWEDVKIMVIAGVSVLLLCFLLGYCMYRKHIFYDEEKVIVGRIFGQSRKVSWSEIGRVRIKKNGNILLYDRDGVKCLEASDDMTNYSEFYDLVLVKCPRE